MHTYVCMDVHTYIHTYTYARRNETPRFAHWTHSMIAPSAARPAQLFPNVPWHRWVVVVRTGVVASAIKPPNWPPGSPWFFAYHILLWSWHYHDDVQQVTSLDGHPLEHFRPILTQCCCQGRKASVDQRIVLQSNWAGRLLAVARCDPMAKRISTLLPTEQNHLKSLKTAGSF